MKAIGRLLIFVAIALSAILLPLAVFGIMFIGAATLFISNFGLLGAIVLLAALLSKSLLVVLGVFVIGLLLAVIGAANAKA